MALFVFDVWWGDWGWLPISEGLSAWLTCRRQTWDTWVKAVQTWETRDMTTQRELVSGVSQFFAWPFFHPCLMFCTLNCRRPCCHVVRCTALFELVGDSLEFGGDQSRFRVSAAAFIRFLQKAIWLLACRKNCSFSTLSSLLPSFLPCLVFFYSFLVSLRPLDSFRPFSFFPCFTFFF